AENVTPINGGSSRIAELEAELSRMKDHMLRALADADNTRKRAVKEREDASRFAVTSFARDMLEIADNFRRALDAVPVEVRGGDNPLIKNLMEGIEAIERTLMKIFEKHGIKKIEPIDAMFDPNFHEVIFEAPMPGKEPGTIIQVAEPGYVLNDRLLRPARVGVAGGSGHKIDKTA
ncbi:MAG TPA: nucleotide exchange factor GrpE, partial [Micavibrio sp.]